MSEANRIDGNRKAGSGYEFAIPIETGYWPGADGNRGGFELTFAGRTVVLSRPLPILDCKVYLIKGLFNLLGRLGSPLFNFGLTRDLERFADLPYGAEAEQRLDILRPESPRPGTLPVLVYFHGGGWISADRKICAGIAAGFSRNGFLTFNVDYRLAPKSRFPAPLQDAAQAMSWIHRNAARYGGDPAAIVLAGDSAGAQIAAWYASALYNPGLFRKIGTQGPQGGISVKGLLLFYGVYNFDTLTDARFPFIRVFARSLLGSDPHGYAENARLASPIGQISRDLPPVWLCVGKRDGLFAQSEAYARALKDQGVRCRTLFFPDDYRAPHGFLFFRWLKSSRTAVAAAREFLRDCAGMDCQYPGNGRPAVPRAIRNATEGIPYKHVE